ncbi:hypothetical protein XELAEV_18025199mg [Xenopus laevis]|uniref:Uncharacterized protein n=1 Tax=Xenopus laevis TaxID=8355 RepID=A0A974HLN2_XENLA|nr:hypothetical protein XELAEV_18025199mg [Xenopus laevis]
MWQLQTGKMIYGRCSQKTIPYYKKTLHIHYVFHAIAKGRHPYICFLRAVYIPNTLTDSFLQHCRVVTNNISCCFNVLFNIIFIGLQGNKCVSYKRMHRASSYKWVVASSCIQLQTFLKMQIFCSCQQKYMISKAFNS